MNSLKRFDQKHGQMPYKNVLICLLTVLTMCIFLAASCSEDDSDDDDDDEELTFPDNPYDPGTPECDRTCIEWADQAVLDCIDIYSECWGKCETQSCADNCESNFENCGDKVNDAYRNCGIECDGCLESGLYCKEQCGDSNSCSDECAAEVYACNEWDFSCFTSCGEMLDVCEEDANELWEMYNCSSDYVGCKEECRQTDVTEA